MPVKAPVKVAPVYTWTGCYVGGHIGAASGKTEISEPLNPIDQNFAPADAPIAVDGRTAFLGGAQVGCDYQFAANWVIGAAGDFSWTNIDGQTTDPFFAGKTGGPILLNAKTDWITTATVRLGYAWDRWMLYGKGGAAWIHNEYSIQNLAFWGNPSSDFCASGGIVPCNPAGSETRTGWTLGVGIAWAFANNWFAAIEYARYDFGNRSVTLTDPNGAGGIPVSGPVNVKQDFDSIRLNINYRFDGWGRP
jgi:outer membrane immunogenic protein